ncbi:MAG: hypothetical protein ACI94Y_001814 [Maribacter sp.]|jgi:hypothetical protein
MTHSWHHLKPQFYKAFAFALLTLGCFSILIAQNGDGLTSALKTNLLLSEQLGMLGPVAISPYWGLFLASAASLFGGVDNEFLVTHPFMGNWIVFLLFGLSAMLTSVPNVTKYSKALGVASSYLEDHVSIVIVVLVITLPILHNTVGSPAPTNGEFGIIDMSLYSLVMMAFSAFYMFVVTTVRLFFELIAFVTPIPLIDSIVEIAKKVSSLILMGVYFISPEIALGISLLLLLIAFFLFKKANTTMNYFKQIYITPILSWIIRRKRGLVDTGIVNRIKGLDKGINATIPVWPIHDYGRIKKQKKTWLIEEEEGDLYLYQLHLFRRFSQQSIDKDTLEGGVNIRQYFNYLTLSGKDKHDGNDLELRINREYFIHKKEIIRICELTGGTNDNIALETDESWWKKIKKYFSSKQVAVDTEIG